MREIKFRAWDETDREMIDLEKDCNSVWFSSIVRNRVSGYILMQFTGLQDKNGKDIYEGDLIVLKAEWGGVQEIVVFQDGCFGIKDGGGVMTFQDTHPRGWEIIGNIHETDLPEQEA